MLAKYTDEVKKHVWNSITEAVWQYADSHGRVNLDNEVICIVERIEMSCDLVCSKNGIDSS
jgi:hypothetical protein